MSSRFPRRARLLAALALLPLLAACGGTAPAGDAALGVRGTVVDSVRGTAPAGDVLRPEPGNIWSEGLEPTRAPAAR